MAGPDSLTVSHSSPVSDFPGAMTRNALRHMALPPPPLLSAATSELEDTNETRNLDHNPRSHDTL